MKPSNIEVAEALLILGNTQEEKNNVLMEETHTADRTSKRPRRPPIRFADQHDNCGITPTKKKKKKLSKPLEPIESVELLQQVKVPSFRFAKTKPPVVMQLPDYKDNLKETTIKTPLVKRKGKLLQPKKDKKDKKYFDVPFGVFTKYPRECLSHVAAYKKLKNQKPPSRKRRIWEPKEDYNPQKNKSSGPGVRVLCNEWMLGTARWSREDTPPPGVGRENKSSFRKRWEC
jgi:hypothetical protein